jgi:hypothetical protein
MEEIERDLGFNFETNHLRAVIATPRTNTTNILSFDIQNHLFLIDCGEGNKLGIKAQ